MSESSSKAKKKCPQRHIIIAHLNALLPSDKAPDNSKITARVLKCCLSSIAPTLTTIINASLISGTFQLIWKTAEVIPILKQGDYQKLHNNRPVSLLPILSKVCERIAVNQFIPYLKSNISDYQQHKVGTSNDTQPKHPCTHN